MKLQEQWSGWSFFQEIKKLDHDVWEWAECNGVSVHYTRKRTWISHYWDCTHWSLTKNDPHLCNFMETHYLNKQVKSIKDPPTCARWGPLNLARQRVSLTSTPSEVMMATGSSQDRPLPHILCGTSPLKYLDNSTDAHFPGWLTDAKSLTKWKKLTPWWPWVSGPQTYWRLWVGKANPHDSALLPHRQSENCTQAHYISWDAPPLPCL